MTVSYWACCLEVHEQTSWQHYHMSRRFSDLKCWKPVKIALIEKHVKVNFSDVHETYIQRTNVSLHLTNY